MSEPEVKEKPTKKKKTISKSSEGSKKEKEKEKDKEAPPPATGEERRKSSVKPEDPPVSDDKTRRKSSVKPEELSGTSKQVTGEERRKSTIKSEEVSPGQSEERRKSSVKQEEPVPVIETPSENKEPPIKQTNVEQPKSKRASMKKKEEKKEILEDLDENKLRDLKEAFEIFDLNHDGIIDFNDLKLTFMTMGRLNVPDSEMISMLAEATNPLDFDSFVQLLGYKTIELDPEEILVEALSQWDYDNSGFISEERIKHDLMTWGDRFTEQEVEYALEDAPTTINPKGVHMINYITFCKTLCGLRKKTKSPCPEDFMKNV